MDIVDSQVHVWDTPGREYGDRDPVPAERMVEWMDGAGVAAGLIHAGRDPDYQLRTATRLPDRFRVVVPIRPDTLDVQTEMRALRDQPVVAGARVVVLPDD